MKCLDFIVTDRQNKFNLKKSNKINHEFRGVNPDLFIIFSWKISKISKSFKKSCQIAHKKQKNETKNVKDFGVKKRVLSINGRFCMVFYAVCLEMIGKMYDNRHNKREELYKLTGKFLQKEK